MYPTARVRFYTLVPRLVCAARSRTLSLRVLFPFARADVPKGSVWPRHTSDVIGCDGDYRIGHLAGTLVFESIKAAVDGGVEFRMLDEDKVRGV